MSRLITFLSRNSKLLFFTWLIMILIASSIPGLPSPKIKVSGGSSIRLDYFIHVVEFFVLSVLFMLWMLNKEPKPKFHTWILFLIIGIAFAFFIEFYQYLIPVRRFNIVDSIFNSIGVVLGLLFLYLLRKHFESC